jgi:hypothetical protein
MPCSSQFQRQRNAVEPSANQRDVMGVAFRQFEIGTRGLCALHEQLDSGLLAVVETSVTGPSGGSRSEATASSFRQQCASALGW